MENIFKNKKILVTGGTGSFGHQIVDRLLKLDPKEIRIFSRDEKKQYDMQFEYKNNPKLRFIIGDVRFKDSLKDAMRDVFPVPPLWLAIAILHIRKPHVLMFASIKLVAVFLNCLSVILWPHIRAIRLFARPAF